MGWIILFIVGAVVFSYVMNNVSDNMKRNAEKKRMHKRGEKDFYQAKMLEIATNHDYREAKEKFETGSIPWEEYWKAIQEHSKAESMRMHAEWDLQGVPYTRRELYVYAQNAKALASAAGTIFKGSDEERKELVKELLAVSTECEAVYNMGSLDEDPPKDQSIAAEGHYGTVISKFEKARRRFP